MFKIRDRHRLRERHAKCKGPQSLTIDSKFQCALDYGNNILNIFIFKQNGKKCPFVATMLFRWPSFYLIQRQSKLEKEESTSSYTKTNHSYLNNEPYAMLRVKSSGI